MPLSEQGFLLVRIVGRCRFTLVQAQAVSRRSLMGLSQGDPQKEARGRDWD